PTLSSNITSRALAAGRPAGWHLIAPRRSRPGGAPTDARLIVGAPAPGANAGSSAETVSHRGGAPTKADRPCPPAVGAPASGPNVGLPAETLSHRGGPASRRRSYRTEVSHSAWAAFLPLTRSK